MSFGQSQKGASLLESVIAVAIASVLISSIASAISLSVGQSADPLVRQQALFLAEAMMETVLSRDYVDPDSGLVCDPAEALFQNYDNICDYNGLSLNGGTDAFGNAILGLETFDTNVTVDSSGSVSIAGIGGLNADIPIWMEITVSVTWKELVTVTLTAHESSPVLIP